MPMSGPRNRKSSRLPTIAALTVIVAGLAWLATRGPVRVTPASARRAALEGRAATGAKSTSDERDVMTIDVPAIASPATAAQNSKVDSAVAEPPRALRPAGDVASLPVPGNPLAIGPNGFRVQGSGAPMIGGALGGSGAQSSQPAAAPLQLALATSGGNHGDSRSDAQLTPGVGHEGWVLIAGGQGAGKLAVHKAELFDPAKVKFVEAPPMNTARSVAAAATLADGRTLIAGGADAKGHALASAEIYDPAANAFATTGALQIARAWPTATLISGCGCAADGKVLIAGGVSALAGGHSLTSAELYDSATGSFTATGAMLAARGAHSATLVASGPLAGDVLIAGGLGADGAPMTGAELYDPRTGSFSATGAMGVPRAHHTATALASGAAAGALGGEILITGGDTTAGETATSELFDPATGQFSAAATMASARAYHAAALMADGRVFIAGGENSADGNVLSAEIFVPAAGVFVPAGQMSSAQVGGSATVLADGRVLVAAGRSANADVYDPVARKFTITPPMLVTVADAAAVLLH
jgi:hypothetical protein